MRSSENSTAYGLDVVANVELNELNEIGTMLIHRSFLLYLIPFIPTSKVEEVSTMTRKTSATPTYDPMQGYLFYRNLGKFGDKEKWGNIKTEATDFFKSVTIADANLDDIRHYLLSQAETEREKELRKISDFFGQPVELKDANDYQTVFQVMNDIMNYKQDLLQSAYGFIRDAKTLQARGYQLDRTFPNTFFPILVDEMIEKLYTSGGVFHDNMLKDTINAEVVGKGISRMYSSEGKGIFSEKTSQPWKEKLDLLHEIKSTYERSMSHLAKDIHNFFNFGEAEEKIKAVLAELSQYEDLSSAKSVLKKPIEKILRDSAPTFKVEGRSAGRAAGLMGEKAAELTLNALFAERFGETGQNGVHYTVIRTSDSGSGGRFFSSDLIAFQGTAEFDLTDRSIFNTDKVFDKVDTAEEVENLLKKARDKIDEGLEGTFVFESTKLYTSYAGFTGTTRNLTSAIETLEAAGYDNAKAVLHKVANTTKGALASSNGKHFRNRASRSMAQYIAYFLFDSWSEIGKESGKIDAVHIFRLSNIVVPLSWVLEKMAKAIEESIRDIDKVMRVSFPEVEKGELIKYKDYPYEGEETKLSKSIERWEDQKKAVLQMKVTTKFLSNFKELMKNDLKYLEKYL